MTRPTDWSPLDLSSDPVPGDPIVVRQFATSYGNVADAIIKAANRLNAIADHSDHWESKYVDEFRDKAKSVAKNISKAHERYAGVADAMTHYAGPLEQAQSLSLSALTKARNAQDASSTASTSHHHYTELLKDPSLSEADREHYTQLDNQAQTDAHTGSSHLASAKSDLQNAINMRDTAAKKAEDAVNDIEGSGGLKDSWWDRFSNWVKEHAELLNKIVSWMNKIVSFLAILAPFLTFIPILGEIVDALVLIATIVTVLNAVVQMATGAEGIGKGIFDIALAVIPFGAGKLMGRAADAAEEGITTSAATTLRTSTAAQGIKGMTQVKALNTVEEAAAGAKPSILSRFVTDDPVGLAKMQSLGKMDLTVAGPSARIASAVSSNSWKFAAVGRPFDYMNVTGATDDLDDSLFPNNGLGGSEGEG